MQVICGYTFPSTPEESLKMIHNRHPSLKCSHHIVASKLAVIMCRTLHHYKVEYDDNYNPYYDKGSDYISAYKKFKLTFQCNLKYFREEVYQS